jgi:hypothetical protein
MAVAAFGVSDRVEFGTDRLPAEALPIARSAWGFRMRLTMKPTQFARVLPSAKLVMRMSAYSSSPGRSTTGPVSRKIDE